MKKHFFKPVSPQVSLPALEEATINYWKENKTFEKSIESRPKTKTWTFLDGPPFVTGMPHYGTLLSSIPKDVFGRYWTMKGYRVDRVWGWDGHGLPIENKVETKLNIKRKKDIEEKVGVKKFIEECLGYVQEVSSEWAWYVDHIGRWADFKNAYKTWDTNYMESVMWVFKNLYSKDLIYKGLRVSLYCPHCSTPISNFEVAMDADNYKELTEPANTYKYKLTGEDKTFLLAWSTTPWNKIVTPALAVNPKLTYVKVSQDGEFYILAESTIKMLLDKPYKIVENIKGSDLVGKEFDTHYNFYKVDPDKKIGVVIPGDFVSSDEGTGIVTIAAYGEEDLKAMQENNIQIYLQVDDEGKLKPEVPNWGGMNYLEVNPLVNEDLKSRGLLYREDQHTHTIPTCWRCHTRLFYAPQNAWYVDVQKLKPALEKTNEEVTWVPDHFKYGRYLNSLKSAPDWCISRSRYWGSPVPVWECEKCEHRFVPESINELETWSGKKITTLHKPEIDDVTGPCSKCGSVSKRVPEVLDSWIEAGSASFAERHYPFEGKVKLASFFPPDFVTEYTGQIRAWFYVLHVIAVGLFDSMAFKNVLVSGVILGTDGRKMSKNFKNYPDPKELLEKHGGDALRLYLLSSPVMRGEDIRISEEEYRNQMRTFLLTLWNVYSFFVMYANLNNWYPTKSTPSKNVLDQWIISKLNQLIDLEATYLDAYDTVSSIVEFKKFVEDLSTWYVRRSRDRVGEEFFSTLHHVLTTFTQLLAPVAPFISEEIYRNLTGEESVHLTDYPKADTKKIDKVLEEKMARARKIVEVVHAIRKANNLKVRQPLSKIVFFEDEDVSTEKLSGLEDVLKSELNIKSLEFYTSHKEFITHDDQLQNVGRVEFTFGDAHEHFSVFLDTELTDDLKAEGEAREIVRQIQDARKELKTAMDDQVVVTLPSWPEAFEDYIKTQTLAIELRKGPELSVLPVSHKS